MRFVGTKNKWIVAFVAMVFISTILTPSAQEEGTQNGEWPSYGGDLAHTRYSPLDQITGLLTIVIGGYFGSRGVEKVFGNNKDKS